MRCKVNRLMTTSVKKKTTQTSRAKKEAQSIDQIDEYIFFVSSNGNGGEEASAKDNKKQSLGNSVIKSKKSIDFFLPNRFAFFLSRRVVSNPSFPPADPPFRHKIAKHSTDMLGLVEVLLILNI